MRKALYVLILVFVVAFGGTSGTSEELASPSGAFYSANSSYQKGDYEAAAEGYEAIVKAGFKNARVYYNLGNTYFQLGRIGKAILNYERARLSMPMNSDLIANYRKAKELVKQQDLAPGKVKWFNWTRDWLTYLTLAQTFFIMFAVYLFLAFYIILTKFFRKGAGFSAIIIILLSILLIITIVPIPLKIKENLRAAIVVSDITDARFEPIDGATVNYPLYGGMKVDVIRKRPEWYKVRRSDGKLGWVRRQGVELIGM